MSDVRVTYNSDKPAQVGALGYAKGNEVHLGPGQEQHLSHEGWHVIQQRQGRVARTREMKNGMAANDEDALEREADEMGRRALTESIASGGLRQERERHQEAEIPASSPASAPVQFIKKRNVGSGRMSEGSKPKGQDKEERWDWWKEDIALEDDGEEEKFIDYVCIE